MRDGRLMPAWAAYLFSSNVTNRTLKIYASAGHEQSMEHTWRRLYKRYGQPRTNEEGLYPAKPVYHIAHSYAKRWLRRHVACKHCDGIGCSTCHDTGYKFYEEPLDATLHEPVYYVEHEALVHIELDSMMQKMDEEQDRLIEGALTARPTRLGWLAQRLTGSMGVEEAREDYQHLLQERQESKRTKQYNTQH